jgi:3D (Asp-Asp-Asp) domain-containing protein
MIRYFFSILFLLIGMGLPLLAKNVAPAKPAPSTFSKAGTKAVPAPTPTSAALAKQEIVKKSVVVVTSDRSRANIAATAAAAPQPSTPPVPKVAAKNAQEKPVRTAAHKSQGASVVATKTSASKTSASSMSPVIADDEPLHSASGERLARVTAYWASEGDYYTGRGISSTGVRLHDGHCAVDPSIIPYGSVVEVAGYGKFLAVDTGSAVISRTAARESGHNPAERHAIVVDLYFASRREGEDFAAGAAKFVNITWWTPSSLATATRLIPSFIAEDDWTKIQAKQL